MLASVAEQYLIQRELTERGEREASRAWKRRRLDLLPVTVGQIMVLAASEAEVGIAMMLDEQEIEAPQTARINPELFGRQASDGRALTGLFQQAISEAALQAMVVTQIADTWRAAGGSSLLTRPAATGYTRHVGATCCSRCAVLSGRFYRWSSGFLRHPRCRCINVPTTGSKWSEAAETPEDLFQQGRITDLSATSRRAIEDGADIGQLVNARRRTAGMRFAQSPAVKRQYGNAYTTEGATVRGRALQQQTALRRNGQTQPRLMPESIYANAPSRDEAIRQLKLYGWIRDDVAAARGRSLLADQRRIARNARQRERRAESRAI